jgi:hypothetical protein
MKTTLLILAALVAACSAASPMGPVVIEQNKGTIAEVGKALGSQPIAFVAVIKLKSGADANKFIATREAVAKKAMESYPNVKVAYVKVGVMSEGGRDFEAHMYCCVVHELCVDKCALRCVAV